MSTEPTPGYTARITFAFTTDKRNRRIAYRWSRQRWLRVPYVESKLFVEQGLADESPYTGNADQRLGL